MRTMSKEFMTIRNIPTFHDSGPCPFKPFLPLMLDWITAPAERFTGIIHKESICNKFSKLSFIGFLIACNIANAMPTMIKVESPIFV